LLALSLAALEREVEALPADVQTVLDGRQWVRMCPAVLASCSADAAAAWLGYIPASLQAAAGAHAPSSRTTPVAGGGVDTGGASDDGPWYAVEERLPLYCSVLRLLKSSSIRLEQPVTRGGDCAGASSSGGGSALGVGSAAAAELEVAEIETQWQAHQLLLSRCQGGNALR
jgi:hypothetical protein